MLSPTVENVLSIQKKRGERMDKLKEKILQMVKERIQNYANFSQTNCIYEIPTFLFGYSPYNLQDMNKYISKKLKNEGFYIQKINEQFIYISWNINDLGKTPEQNNSSKSSKSKNSNVSNTDTSLNAFVNSSKSNFF